MLVDLLQDQTAPICVIRLWGHCQQQKTHRFPKLSASALKAITCFTGDAGNLWLSMQSAGFIRLDGDIVIVHQWDQYNSTLITSWRNGRRGGRPRAPKKPKPVGLPRDTHGQPVGWPIEKIEKIESIAQPSAPRARNELFDALAKAEDSDPMQVTKQNGARIGTALAQIRAVCADLTPEEILRRATNHRRKWPNITVTANSLASHWAKLGTNGAIDPRDRRPTPQMMREDE